MSARENVKILGMSVGTAVVALIAIVGLAIGGVYLTSFYSKTTANTRGETQQREANQGSGAFRQATYEQFFDLCASVQATEQKIKNVTEVASKSSDPAVVDRAYTTTMALLNSRAEAIASYNKLASEKHRQQFLDSNLPYRLDVDLKETQCAS